MKGGLDRKRVLYLQIFRISFGGRVRRGDFGRGAVAGWEKIGAVVGRIGGLIRRLSAILPRKLLNF